MMDIASKTKSACSSLGDTIVANEFFLAISQKDCERSRQKGYSGG